MMLSFQQFLFQLTEEPHFTLSTNKSIDIEIEAYAGIRSYALAFNIEQWFHQHIENEYAIHSFYKHAKAIYTALEPYLDSMAIDDIKDRIADICQDKFNDCKDCSNCHQNASEFLAKFLEHIHLQAIDNKVELELLKHMRTLLSGSHSNVYTTKISLVNKCTHWAIEPFINTKFHAYLEKETSHSPPIENTKFFPLSSEEMIEFKQKILKEKNKFTGHLRFSDEFWKELLKILDN